MTMKQLLLFFFLLSFFLFATYSFASRCDRPGEPGCGGGVGGGVGSGSSSNSISGIVFLDADKDGIQNYGEYGYDGYEAGTFKGPATIKITMGGSTNSTQTDSSGNYSFSGLSNGRWCVSLQIPPLASFIETTTDPQCITVNNSQSATVNFGIYTSKAIISGTVFAGGTGYSGAAVTATSYNSDGSIDKQYSGFTRPDGTYSLINLRADSYTVSLTVPPGYTSTSTNPLTGVSVSGSTNANGINFTMASVAFPTFTPAPTSSLPTFTPVPTNPPGSPTLTPTITNSPGLSCPSGWYYVKHSL